MPKLVALERFYYDGRNVEMGETFVVEERDIALLTDAIKPMAKQPDRGDPDPPEPEVEPERRRSYKRRDMKAED